MKTYLFYIETLNVGLLCYFNQVHWQTIKTFSYDIYIRISNAHYAAYPDTTGTLH